MSALPPRSLPAWRRWARSAWLLAAAVAVAFALARRWPEVRAAVATADRAALLAAAAAGLVAVGASALVWRALLAGLGARVPLRPAVRVFFISQLGKYLPGAVWPVLAQVELARDLGVTARVAGAGVAVFLWVHLLTGVAVAAVGLAVGGHVPAAAALLALPALALLAPALLRTALSVLLRAARREPLPATPGGPAVASAVAWALFMWLVYGVHLRLLVAAFGEPIPLLVSSGTFAAAWVGGFVLLVAPAGAGVREGLLVALLAPTAPPGAVLAVALASRLLLTTADALWALVTAAQHWRRR